ncbi:MAG: peptidylprolyl isomerase, partial [Silvibacterium sp.]
MKPTRRTLLLSVVASLSFSAFAQQSTAPATDQSLPDSPETQAHVSPQPTGPTVIFDTSMGRMTCKLFSK